MARFMPALLALVCVILGTPTAAAQPDAIGVAATVNGHDVAGTTATRPLPLNPDGPADVAVTITNRGDQPVEIRAIELSGRVLGLTFFSYTTAVDITVAPGSTGTVNYRLELTKLSGQATGLIAGALTLQDGSGAGIAAIATVTDVRGSLISVYGLFGIALATLTVLALVDAAIAVAGNRLSANRWRRGLRLLTPGIGIGLVLAFSTSIARLWVPDTTTWLIAAAAAAAAFFAIGYFSPTPVHDDVDEDEEQELFDDDVESMPA
jgi:hypothetical protein